MFKPFYPRLVTGFSMLEMLVALLILSVGLLGVATLQVRGQQFNQVGYLRTQAAFLAYDMMDRIRINIDNDDNDDGTTDLNQYADDGNYAYPASGNFTQDGPSGSGPNTQCDNNNGSPCSVEQLKDYDLDNWFNLVRETLPGGNARLLWRAEEIDSNGNGVLDASEDINNNGQFDPAHYTITIRWINIIDRDDDNEEEQEWILILQ